MNKKKILIVEDEKTCWQIASLILTDTGEYDVKVESDGNQALATAKDYRPDLILLDVVIPDTDGIEINNMLILEKDLKEIPVVFITGILSEDEIDIQGGVLYGRPCLSKPIVKEKLLECIKKNLKWVKTDLH